MTLLYFPSSLTRIPEPDVQRTRNVEGTTAPFITDTLLFLMLKIIYMYIYIYIYIYIIFVRKHTDLLFQRRKKA